MEKIESIQELKDPKFIKPIEINYIQKGVKKRWEAVITHDGVAILLWHKHRDAFVFVKQLRATVFNKNKTDGYVYELCAGIIDKDATKAQIAKEEILEECGYDVPVQNLQKISTFYTNVGISGTQQTLYYAELHEDMKCSDGGGIEDEDIEVIYIPVSEAKRFMFDESYQKTTGVMLSIYWFFENIKKENK